MRKAPVVQALANQSMVNTSYIALAASLVSLLMLTLETMV
jgi:hypothetical protein